MNALEVRIINLAPIHVVSFLGFGPNPEELAWEQLTAWAGPQGLLESSEKHRLFGFNNPNPSAGSPNYGYEVWIEVDPEEVATEEDVKIKRFQGGIG